MSELHERAADMLTAYAELIRRDGASRIEEHHYLPEVEFLAQELRATRAAQAVPAGKRADAILRLVDEFAIARTNATLKHDNPHSLRYRDDTRKEIERCLRLFVREDDAAAPTPPAAPAKLFGSIPAEESDAEFLAQITPPAAAEAVPAGVPWWQIARECGCWTDKADGDLGYVHFGSTEALRVYTTKITAQAYQAGLAVAPTPPAAAEARDAVRLLRAAEVLFAPLCRDATAWNWLDETRAALAAHQKGGGE